MIDLFVTWNVSPIIFELGSLQVRWYGLFYAIGFLVGITCVDKALQHDGAPKGWTDTVFLWIAVATIVGARLGHVFFYDWDYYSQNLSEIPKVWHGGLASHGGALAVVITSCILSVKLCKQKMWWLCDRVWIGAAFLAILIRCGNLMNSEIYGHPTDMPWGFIFVRGDEQFFDEMGNLLPCHPTQLYEALAYAITWGVLMIAYWKFNGGKYYGLLSGIGFLGVFLSRPIIELFKNNQSAFETNMFGNMGQWLSVPFIILGVFLIVRAIKIGPQEFKIQK